MCRLLPCGPRRRALGTDGVMVIVGGVVSVDVPAAARAVGRPATAAWRLAMSQLHPPACAYAHVEKGSLRAGPLRPCSRTDGRASPRSAGVVHRLPSVVRAGSGIQLCRVVLGCRGWACRQVESASISTRCPECPGFQRVQPKWPRLPITAGHVRNQRSRYRATGGSDATAAPCVPDQGWVVGSQMSQMSLIAA
jgi:hypothetical protein